MRNPPRLALPDVDVEFRALPSVGGVGGVRSSDGRPKELIVEDRSRKPNRRGGARTGEDLAECVELLESLRNRLVAGAAKATEDFASAAWVGELSGDVNCANCAASVWRRWSAVTGVWRWGLGVIRSDLVEKPLVEALGVAGAVSGNSGGGGILTGSGKSDLRLFRRGSLKNDEVERLAEEPYVWSPKL